MAWTPGAVSVLKKLYASFWSVQAMALALGMTRMAVINKITRLRRQDPEFELACLRRQLLRWEGRPCVNIDQAREVLAQDGVQEGLRRLIARP